MSTGKLSMFVLFVSLFFIDVIAQSSRHRESLGGLDGLYVVVENFNPDAQTGGLSRNQLKSDAELRLRRNGVRVTNAFGSYLYISITAIRDRTTSGRDLGYSYCVEVSLVEEAMLVREPFHTVPARTWDVAIMGSSANSNNFRRNVREIVGDLVDRFSNDYLAANP